MLLLNMIQNSTQPFILNNLSLIQLTSFIEEAVIDLSAIMHEGYSTIRVFKELKILTDQPLIFFGVFEEIYAFIISNRQAIRDSAGFTPSKNII